MEAHGIVKEPYCVYATMAWQYILPQDLLEQSVIK
jgi:hypothetical protein